MAGCPILKAFVGEHNCCMAKKKRKKSKTDRKLDSADGQSTAARTSENTDPKLSEQAEGGADAQADLRKETKPEKGISVFTIGVVVLALLLAGGVAAYFALTKSDRELQTIARTELKSENYQASREAISSLEWRGSARSSDFLIGAQAASALEEYEKALEWLGKIDNNEGLTSVDARLIAGDVNIAMGYAQAALKEYQTAKSLAQSSEKANRSLAQLLNLLGRRVEAQEYLFLLIRSGNHTPDDLAQFGNRFRNVDIIEVSQRFIDTVPGDQSPQLNVAKAMIQNDKANASISILENITKSDPSNAEAMIWMGRGYAAVGDQKKFQVWHAELSDEAKRHPDYFLTLGLWASDQDQVDSAKRCFWEAIKVDPNSMLANYRLGILLGKDKRGEPFRKRAELLRTLDEALLRIQLNVQSLSRARHLDFLKTIAETTEQLGRNWEAFSWYSGIVIKFGDVDWAFEGRERLKSTVRQDSPQTLASMNPAKNVDFSDLPLPSIATQSALSQTTGQSQNGSGFADYSQIAGIDFQYQNGEKDGRKLQRMYELMGGGIGVLDYDGNGFPDLVMTQGGQWNNDTVQQTQFDRLYRNSGGETFEDVQKLARFVEAGFSQGTSIGDFNSDGFDDIYVGNIGQNRLFLNNGDGTFSDVTAESQIVDSVWTTSTAMADLDGDGLPEIFDVNYLSGDNVFEKLCKIEGQMRSCPPTQFQAAQDRVWRNVGDGSFTDMTETSGVLVPRGNGLGIVVGNLNDDQMLDIFVANDETSNFLFINESGSGTGMKFSQQADLFNVGFDQDGRAEGCMGIAVADLNSDNRLDLFVTNYENQTNTLYLSNKDFFTDRARGTGLSSVSVPFVGFGTQFLDGDLDGDADLMVTNGHVTDFSDLGRDLAMPTQYFENESAKFTLVGAAKAGPFFEKRSIGRAMARLDWNRDGKPEVAISNVGSQATLLLNQTKTNNHFLTLRLVGTESARRPIGCRIRATVNGKQISAQLTAGDGFQSSNESTILLGLGEATSAEKLEIQWPSGKSESFDALAADRHLIIVEGAGEIVETPSNR